MSHPRSQDARQTSPRQWAARCGPGGAAAPSVSGWGAAGAGGRRCAGGHARRRPAPRRPCRNSAWCTPSTSTVGLSPGRPRACRCWPAATSPPTVTSIGMTRATV